MLEFTALGPGFKVRGLDVVPVKNPVECQDFGHLLEHEVLIDGQVRRVKGVERFTHAAPRRAGEKIGLMLHNAKTAPAPRREPGPNA